MEEEVESIHSRFSFDCQPAYSWAWKHNNLGLKVSPLALFCTHLHRTKTICPPIPLLGMALRNASVSVGKVHSVLHSGGNFPEDVILFSHFLSHIWKHTRARPPYMRACMLMCFIYLCAEQTPRCVSLVSCVTMMKGTCCSQQKPLSTLCYWHPGCIIHKSSGNSVTSLS